MIDIRCKREGDALKQRLAGFQHPVDARWPLAPAES
jgi:hypothetical protein